MDQANLKVTLIQPDIIWEDIESNLKKLMNIILSGVSETDLIILPEYFATGFTMNPHKFAITMENLAYVIGVNRIGKDGRDISYSGNSLIYDPHGRIIARLTPNQEKTGTFTLSLDKLNNIRKKFPVHLDADNFEILDKP
jgi:predicted amidohydrolase